MESSFNQTTLPASLLIASKKAALPGKTPLHSDMALSSKATKSASPPGLRAAKKRVYLIDDHIIVREGLKRLLNSEPDIEVCGEADNGKDGLMAVQISKPDLVIIDISLPGADGLEWLKSFRVHYPELRLLVLSMHDEKLYAERALRAGAKGYIMKTEPPSTLLLAIKKVFDNDVFLSDAASSRLLRSMISRPDRPTGLQRLTDRELEILKLIGTGLSTGEIAKKLNISAKTVESHRGNLRQKLELKNGAELVRYSIANCIQPG